MKIRTLRLFVIAALFLVVAASAATADNWFPPPWQRGASGTTFAEWEFLTADINPVPDVWGNVNGVPTMTVGSPHPWYQEYGGRPGVWELSGIITTKIPNFPDQNPFKDIWVQVTWSSAYEDAVPVVDELMWGFPTKLVRRAPLEYWQDPTGVNQGVQWFQDVYKIHIEPNPRIEKLRIEGPIWVDELVIDTICVPEPGSILALAVGCTGLIGLARRRRP